MRNAATSLVVLRPASAPWTIGTTGDRSVQFGSNRTFDAFDEEVLVEVSIYRQNVSPCGSLFSLRVARMLCERRH